MELLTLEEAIKLIKVSKSTLRRWEKEGKIKSIRTPGGHRRYSVEELERTMGIKKN